MVGQDTWGRNLGGGEAPPVGHLDLYTQKPQEPSPAGARAQLSPSVTMAVQGQGKLVLTSGPNFSFPGTSPSRDDLLRCTACLGLLPTPGPSSHWDSCQRRDSRGGRKETYQECPVAPRADLNVLLRALPLASSCSSRRRRGQWQCW